MSSSQHNEPAPVANLAAASQPLDAATASPPDNTGTYHKDVSQQQQQLLQLDKHQSPPAAFQEQSTQSAPAAANQQQAGENSRRLSTNHNKHLSTASTSNSTTASSSGQHSSSTSSQQLLIDITGGSSRGGAEEEPIATARRQQPPVSGQTTHFRAAPEKQAAPPGDTRRAQQLSGAPGRKQQQPKADLCDRNGSPRQFSSLLEESEEEEEANEVGSSNQNRFVSFDNEDNDQYDQEEDDDYQDDQLLADNEQSHRFGRSSQRRRNLGSSLPKRLFNQIYGTLFGSLFKSATGGGGGRQQRPATGTSGDIIGASRLGYTSSESEDLLSDKRKHRLLSRRRRTFAKTFRGGYRYSRSEISMAIMRKLFHMLFQRSTLALFGAFLIHVTLGTVYTLSNVNSYMTSYMRLNGSPNATYGGAVWISSLCAVGQGFTMVLGGLLERRFSARVACFLGCALHSLSIASTSWSINYGPLAVLLTYGLLPGFGIGLAYMTPMTNGFGWFPNKRGLVAGVILAGFGIGTFVFNMVQTAFVNPTNLSPPQDAGGYFTQKDILDRVPNLFVFMGSVYAMMQFVGCLLIFKPPNVYDSMKDDRPILVEQNISVREAVSRREFVVLFLVYGIITQGVLFVNAMIKEYGQIFIGNDMYLAWVGSMSSIANASGRLTWGIAIDRFSFSQCFTAITILFASLMFIMPFEFILSSKLLYLLCTLGLFGSFSGWMSIFPVHVSRVFGRTNSGVIYGLVFTAQSFGGIVSAIGNHYLIDNFSRFVPFFCHVILNVIGLSIFHLFYPK